MEAKKENPPSITDQLKEYLETRIKLAKYQAIEGGTSFAANLITDLAIIFVIVLAFIFASITLALFLGDVLNGNWKGFGIVAIIYFIVVLVLKYNRQGLEKPIANAFIQKIFKN
jgi:ABC-type sugar transport system permease subunit